MTPDEQALPFPLPDPKRYIIESQPGTWRFLMSDGQVIDVTAHHKQWAREEALDRGLAHTMWDTTKDRFRIEGDAELVAPQ